MGLSTMPDRPYTNQAQLMVMAGDEGSAQAAMEAFMAAVAQAMQDTGVTLMPEVEMGHWVLSQA